MSLLEFHLKEKNCLYFTLSLIDEKQMNAGCHSIHCRQVSIDIGLLAPIIP